MHKVMALRWGLAVMLLVGLAGCQSSMMVKAGGSEPTPAPGKAAALDDFLQSSNFAKLSDDERYATLVLAGRAALEQGQHAAAHRLLVRASASPKADALTWHSRLAAAYGLKDYADSARCISTIANRWPNTLVEINDWAIYKVARSLGEDSAQTAIQQNLLESLFEAKWTDEDGEPNVLWRDLARLLLTKGELRKATAVVARIDSARVVLSLRIDKRFDPLTRGEGQALDVDRSIAAGLAAAQAKARAAPNRLKPLIAYQRLLMDSLRFEQALIISDTVIAEVKDRDGPALYPDFNDEYVWILDHRSQVLQHLGRWDEAVQQQVRAARRPEHGEMNVSQTLNLGMLQADLGHAGEALDAVAELGSMSPYGRMQLEMVRLKAAVQRGDERGEATHLAFMREHRKDAIATWQSALLLTDDLDAAGELLVERLNDEAWRNDALVDMQEYAEVPLTPGDSKRLARWRTVIARPKVQDVLAKVGRTERFKLLPPGT